MLWQDEKTRTVLHCISSYEGQVALVAMKVGFELMLELSCRSFKIIDLLIKYGFQQLQKTIFVYLRNDKSSKFKIRKIISVVTVMLTVLQKLMDKS